MRNRYWLFIVAYLCAYPIHIEGITARAARVACRVVQNKRTLKHAPLFHIDHVAATAFEKFPEKQKELQHACSLFETTPGFVNVISHMIRQQNSYGIEGYWYEIEKAIALHQKHSTASNYAIVKAFDATISSPKTLKSREFDIVAVIDGKTVLIECKNSQWTAPYEIFAPQLLDQKAIAHDRRVTYYLSSKQPIPPRWIQFFEKHGITAEVDECETIESIDE